VKNHTTPAIGSPGKRTSGPADGHAAPPVCREGRARIHVGALRLPGMGQGPDSEKQARKGKAVHMIR